MKGVVSARWLWRPLPHPHQLAVTCAGQAAAIAAKSDAAQARRRAFQLQDFLAGDQVPQAQGAVLACAGQPTTALVKGQRRDRPSRAVQIANYLASLHVPEANG